MNKVTSQTQGRTKVNSWQASGILQRKCACGNKTIASGECEACGKKRLNLQRRAVDSRSEHTEIPPIVHEVLRSSGRPLDGETRAFMEPRFGHDFSQVRVHTDDKAAESARAVSALAYTVGRDVVFGAGKYAPGTDQGRRLLAHELTHTLQQRSAAQPVLGALRTSHPGEPSEVEAERAAHAIAQGAKFVSTVSTSEEVARQDGPDAGAAGAAGSAAGAPDAGPAGGTSPAPPAAGPAPPPAAPVAAPMVRSVEVENQREAITYPVTSSLGAAGRSHWVTIAGTRPDIVVRANLNPALPATDPAVAGLTWESDPAGQLSPGADPLHTELSVPSARKVVVRASLGGNRAETTIWAAFVSGSVTAGPTGPTPTRGASQLNIDTSINFTGRIHPSSIITDADRPTLDGANTVAPPGGTNVCGLALAGGVDHRWDMSRQRRLRNIDPAGLIPTVIAVRNAAGGQGCVHNVSAYPATREIGNDDTNTGDENNDPYASGGVITSQDSPTRIYPDSVGTDGDTIEQHLQFREFARLEFNRTWWTVSNFVPWRAHYRVRKVAGQWQDNGSDAAADNAGF